MTGESYAALNHLREGRRQVTVRASGELRDFYERPETPVSAAQDRAARLVAFLREITAASSGELVIADVGCGDGGSPGWPRTRLRGTGSSAWTGRWRRWRRPGPRG
nr:hypothetical protein GCM10020093_094570 [Planobispora longispora]